MTLRRKLKNYRAYGNGKYLKKEDVEPPVTWTITDVQERSIAPPGKPPVTKLVLSFDGSPKMLPNNITNGDVLFDMTGSGEPEEWIGVTVELRWDPTVTYAGRTCGGIRLRKPQTGPC